MSVNPVYSLIVGLRLMTYFLKILATPSMLSEEEVQSIC